MGVFSFAMKQTPSLGCGGVCVSRFGGRYTSSIMAVVTGIQPFTFWRNTGFAVICAIFALWGWYDYEVKIPGREVDSAAYDKAKETRSTLEKAAETAELKPAELAELDAAKAVLTEIKTRYGSSVPAKPAAYDRPVQMWLYIIGCGVLGVPMFIWPIIRTTRRPYRLDDDGTLRTPSTVITPSDIQDIDMGRWCNPSGDRRSTWTAKLKLKDGRTVLLDDHDYKDMHLIIGAIAHRLYPTQWTSEAKRVEQPAAASTADSASPA